MDSQAVQLSFELPHLSDLDGFEATPPHERETAPYEAGTII